MSDEKKTPIGKALVFSLGMALLLFSVYTVVLYAAGVIAHPSMYFNIFDMALFGAVGSWIGSLLVFLGWHSK